MTSHIPKTYFSTPLSGSAKETRLRIRNIFQGQKKRPAAILMVLAVLLIVLCGSFVAFRPAAADPILVMDVQYYDVYENYIEIPALAMPMNSQPNQAVENINQELANWKQSYQRLLQDHPAPQDSEDVGNQCLFYPSTTQRYLNLVFYRNISRTDLNTGHVCSLVYDREQGRQVTIEDALALAGETQEALFAQLSAQINPKIQQELALNGYYDWDIVVQDPVLEGFRIRSDGSAIFYFTARQDDADDSLADHVSGADHLYIWNNGVFTRYDQYTAAGRTPLVPAEETDQLSPSLWCQWYFEGSEPEGGFARPEDVTLGDPALLDTLLTPVLEGGYPVEERYSITRQVLAECPSGEVTLAAAVLMDPQPRYALSIGLIDKESGALAAPVFYTTGSGGLPHVVTFTRSDGTQCLLYTANGMQQGFSSGEAGLIVFDGSDITWEWPVQGDIRDESSQAYADYQTYWSNHKALLSPGGVEVFIENSSFGPYEGSPLQWEPEHSQLFFAAAEDSLPIGTLWNVRAWLEEFTRIDRNAWNAVNISADWRITSLLQSKTHYPGQESGQISLDLECQSDSDDSLFFSAALIYDPGAGQVTQVVSWNMGSWEEVHPDIGRDVSP